MQKVKYDPEAWETFKKGAYVRMPREVHLKLARPGTVFVKHDGQDKIVAHGAEVKISLPYPMEVKTSEDAAVYVGVSESVDQYGVPLTNMDKRPGLSAAERMVAQSLKEKKVRDALDAIKRREADEKLREKREKAGLQKKQEEEEITDEEAEEETEKTEEKA